MTRVNIAFRPDFGRRQDCSYDIVRRRCRDRNNGAETRRAAADVLAALGPRMTTLAAARSAGRIPASDAVVAWGREAAIRRRNQAHFDAGAGHECIQPLHPDGLPAPDYNALEAMAG